MKRKSEVLVTEIIIITTQANAKYIQEDLPVCVHFIAAQMVDLANLLEKLDQLEVFPRIDDVYTFLLLDSHGSRLKLLFLNYMNCPNHEWVVCLGVPYGTSYWQAEDSSEQNGSYMMAIMKAKAKLVDMKIKKIIKNPHGEKDEIVLVVNQAWNASFARVANPEIHGTVTEKDQ